MLLTGTLAKLDFAELLQMLASAGKSGKLSITQHAGQGVIVLRHGKIIYAASTSVRETLGNILLCKGLLSESQLQKALEDQQTAKTELRLGTVLVKMGVLSQRLLEEVVQEQLQKVISEFLGWKSGHFRFEEIELPDCGEVEFEARDFLLEQGLPPDQVLLELFTQLESASREQASGEPEPSPDTGPSPAPPGASAPPPPAREQNSLRTIMAELRSPEFTGEITLQILNFAQRIVRRGVLFSISRLGYCGVGQFGIEPPAGASADFVRSITFPLEEPTVLREAIERKAAFRGPVPETGPNRLLLRKLGGGWPTEVVVAPLIVGGRVLLVFYGDNLPHNEPIGQLDDLEVVLLHGGLAVEKDLLARRIEHLESLRRDS